MKSIDNGLFKFPLNSVTFVTSFYDRFTNAFLLLSHPKGPSKQILATYQGITLLLQRELTQMVTIHGLVIYISMQF